MLANLLEWLKAPYAERPDLSITRADWVVVSLVTVAGVTLRVWLSLKAAVFVDEMYTWAFAQHGPVDAVRQAIADNGPPLHYVLQSLVDPIVPSSPFGLRLLPIAFSAAAVPVLYLAARQFSSRTTASVAAVMLALSPYGALWTTSARSYALAQLLCLLAGIFILKAARSGRVAYFALYGLCALAAAYTHVFALMACIGIAVGAVIAMPTKQRRIRAVAATTAWIVLWSPWIIALRHHASEARAAVAGGVWFIPAPTGIALPSIHALAQHAPWGSGQVTSTAATPQPASWFFLLICIVGAAILSANRGMPRLTAIVLGAWALTPVVGSIVVSRMLTPIYLHHYTLVVAPALFLLAAVALERTWLPVTVALVAGWIVIGLLEMPQALEVMQTTDLTQMIGFAQATQRANVRLVTNEPTDDGMLVSMNDIFSGAWELGVMDVQATIVELPRAASAQDLQATLEQVSAGSAAVVVVEDQRFVFEGRSRFIDKALESSGWTKVRDGVVEVMTAREYRRAATP